MSQLDLSNKNFITLLDFEPEQLNNVTILNLSNNKLSSLPSSIGNFINLKQLIIQNNRLSLLPREIGNLKKLQILNLSNNQLTFLPPLVGNFINLKQLIIQNNRLSLLPREIGNLKNLHTLNLAGNNLEKLIKEIEQLKNLKTFILDNNKLFNIPREIGNLTNLESLSLLNNNLKRLPESIINLTKLKQLILAGNKLPLPEEAGKKTPKQLISHVLEHQPRPPARAYIFRTFSMDSLLREYGDKLNKTLQRRGIECKNIEKKEDLDDVIGVVFIIVPFDINENTSLLFDIINTCKSKQKKIHIFLHSRDHATGDMMNLEKMDSVIELREKLESEFSDYINFYESFKHVTNLIIEGIQQHSPLIRLQSLKLTNIGHFSNLTIKLDSHATCFEGENGTGKTTILRAMALGIIGSDHVKIGKDKIRELLYVKQLDTDGNIEFENGKIEIDYTVDGKRFANIIELNSIDEGRDIEIINKGDFQALSGKYNLKSLIMGFPQTRGEMDVKKASEVPLKGLTGSHVDDLIPLINNTDEHRLQSFSAWIANLDNTANQKEKKHPDKLPEERKIIKQVFEIITRITEHHIAFQTVRQANPPDVWVSTKDAPKGISLSLLSQGFKIIMGWIGHFVQRMAQAYALSKNFTNENSVVLIDEIDSYLHPKWQARLFQVLQQFFPNTQFITSSHSPLNLSSLKSENIYLLEFDENNKVKCYQPPFNPYGADTNRILRILMGQSERAISNIADLLKKYSDLADSDELDEAKKIREEIIQLIDPEDPELLKTDVVIQAKEFLNI
ncbi:MAG: AAA family ATPase [Desulfobacteraceae bacterium]|nr:AAA family ATPase [Desulfobacteraceae bacterium]